MFSRDNTGWVCGFIVLGSPRETRSRPISPITTIIEPDRRDMGVAQQQPGGLIIGGGDQVF